MTLERTPAAQADRHMPGSSAPERTRKWNSSMADTDAGTRAQAVISTIAADLDEDLIRRRFDEPVDAVVRRFRYQADDPVTSGTFHSVVSDFVGQVCAEGLNKPGAWIDPLSEALDLLDHHYESPAYGRGYVAARLDARDPARGGLPSVITSLAEIIKAVERQKYVQGVFNRRLVGVDWEVRCAIAKLLLARDIAFLPRQLAACSPALLTDEIPSMLLTALRIDSVVHQILSHA